MKTNERFFLSTFITTKKPMSIFKVNHVTISDVVTSGIRLIPDVT